MKKTLDLVVKILITAVLMAAFISSADAKQPLTAVGYSEYQQTELPPPEEKPELTVDDVKSYLLHKPLRVQSRLNEDSPADYLKAGKIIIKVHKARPEYLEVFTQNSANPKDLTPLKLFSDKFWKSHRALVSTGGIYGGKSYPTPNGDFELDSMEPMHYSTLYESAPMPWTMFFNGGIAIHGATPDEYAYLGRPASHGCVRLHPDNAKALYSAVQKRGQDSAVVEIFDN